MASHRQGSESLPVVLQPPEYGTDDLNDLEARMHHEYSSLSAEKLKE
jgi:hypothetical protein